MKILQVHNFYRQPGGEDRACAAEYRLLTERGHSVTQYLAHNDALGSMTLIEAGVKTIWNHKSFQEIGALIRREAPDVIHAHNTFPLISPAIYYAAAAERVPVVQTLHNYRLLCPGGTFFRHGRVCESCLGSFAPYRAAVHGCYRDSRPASIVTASMLVSHKIAGTWKRKIETYIAVTDFSKRKFIEGGLPGDRIAVKPNFLAEDSGPGSGSGGFAVFTGRLSEAKGLDVLLKAWERLGSMLPLKIAGNGPLAGWLRERLPKMRGVEWMGSCDREVVIALLKNATLAVLPSKSHEQLPMAIVEASACGTPVVVPALGSMNEVIVEGVNGIHFRAGDAQDLADKIEAILGRPSELASMRRGARLSFERNYTAERNYELLMRIYEDTIGRYAN